MPIVHEHFCLHIFPIEVTTFVFIPTFFILMTPKLGIRWNKNLWHELFRTEHNSLVDLTFFGLITYSERKENGNFLIDLYTLHTLLDFHFEW